MIEPPKRPVSHPDRARDCEDALEEDDFALLERGRQSPVRNNETLADGKGFDLTVVPLTGPWHLLLVPPRLSDTDVNDTIAGSQTEYQHLVKRQRKVRMLGLSTLGLMTLLLLFASTWVALTFTTLAPFLSWYAVVVLRC